MTTQWLSDNERLAWVRFAAVLEVVPGVLDAQLMRDEGLTHFDYFALAMLSEAPERTLRMSALATQTSSTLPRLSRVMTRLEGQGLVRRWPCAEDRRATNVRLTAQGWAKVVHAAPGHVDNVRSLLDALSAEQIEQLSVICARLLARIDPDGKLFPNAQR